MKRSYIIFLIGIVLIVIGSIFFSFVSNDIQEKYSSIVLIIPAQTLEPQTSSTEAFDLFTPQDTTLIIASSTPNSFLAVRVVDVDGQIMYETAFTKNILIPLDEYEIGTYEITVTNFDERKITVNVIIAPNNMLNEFEDFVPFAYNTIATSVVIFSGVLICIIGTIIFFLERRKQNRV